MYMCVYIGTCTNSTLLYGAYLHSVLTHVHVYLGVYMYIQTYSSVFPVRMITYSIYLHVHVYIQTLLYRSMQRMYCTSTTYICTCIP